MQTKVVVWFIFLPLVAPYPPYKTGSGDQFHGLPDHYGHQDRPNVVVVKERSDHDHYFSPHHDEIPVYVKGNLGGPSNYHGTRSYGGYGEDKLHHDYLSQHHDNDHRPVYVAKGDNYGSYSGHRDYHATNGHEGYYGDHFVGNPGSYHFDPEDTDDDDDDDDDNDDGYSFSLDDFRR